MKYHASDAHATTSTAASIQSPARTTWRSRRRIISDNPAIVQTLAGTVHRR